LDNPSFILEKWKGGWMRSLPDNTIISARSSATDKYRTVGIAEKPVSRDTAPSLTDATGAHLPPTTTTMARGVGLQPSSVVITVPRHASAAASDELVAEVKKLAEEEGKHFVNDFGGAPQTARSRAMVSVLSFFDS
jgi:hypothetical protein